MLKSAENALRLFDIRGDEIFHVQPVCKEDSLFVIEGNAFFSNQTSDGTVNKTSISSGQIGKQPIDFEDAVDISTDSSAIVCHIDSSLINDYLSIKDISDASEPDDSDMLVKRLMFLKSTSVFRMLPINVVEEASKRCQEVTVKKGDQVILQDTSADEFFILLEGEAEVWREELEDDEPQMVGFIG